METIKHKVVRMLMAAIFAVTCMSMQAQTTVTGTVTDSSGEPVIGASVVEKGKSNGAATDIDGNYRIALPAGAKQLTFSYVGYVSKTVDIAGATVDVQLEPASEALQEMVVIGYGTTKKNDLTGSVTAISEKDFNKGVISSPEELINGKIAKASQAVKAGDIIEVTFGNRPIKVKVLSDVEPRTKDVAREMYEIISE